MLLRLSLDVPILETKRFDFIDHFLALIRSDNNSGESSLPSLPLEEWRRPKTPSIVASGRRQGENSRNHRDVAQQMGDVFSDVS